MFSFSLKTRISALISVLLFLVILSSSADSHTQIVNIDATVNDQNNPVNINLEAGVYRVEPIGIADGGTYNAWNPWNRTTCDNAEGCNVSQSPPPLGWRNQYRVISSDITNIIINGVPKSIDTNIPGYHVDNGLVYPTDIIALNGAQSSKFTLTVSGEVGFTIFDDPLTDNQGGMSLRVTLMEPKLDSILNLLLDE